MFHEDCPVLYWTVSVQAAGLHRKKCFPECVLEVSGIYSQEWFHSKDIHGCICCIFNAFKVDNIFMSYFMCSKMEWQTSFLALQSAFTLCFTAIIECTEIILLQDRFHWNLICARRYCVFRTYINYIVAPFPLRQYRFFYQLAANGIFISHITGIY